MLGEHCRLAEGFAGHRAGGGIVSHAGVALIRALAGNPGVTAGLSKALASQRLLVRDRGRVLADLAWSIAGGAEVISDFRVIGDQEECHGPQPRVLACRCEFLAARPFGVVGGPVGPGRRGTSGSARHRRPAAPGLTRPMATNAMPTVITAIHRAVEPMPAMSMPAPRSSSGTTIQRSKGFMTAPPFARSDMSPRSMVVSPLGRHPEPFVIYPGTYGMNSEPAASDAEPGKAGTRQAGSSGV